MTNTKFCPNCSSKNITHDFQDKTYGKFMRIFNVSEDQKKWLVLYVVLKLNINNVTF